MYNIIKMKKIILRTRDADVIDVDRKNFKYYFTKPMLIKDKETMSLSSITAELRPQPPPVYDSGLLVIGGLSIDRSTIPSSIYGGFTYIGDFELDLDNSNKCSVFNSSGGASNGSGGRLLIFIFKDYGSPSFPNTIEIAQVLNSGNNYEVGDYIIVNETAFPSGYLATSVNMRINITKVDTTRITTPYPTGVITGLDFDSSYRGEISTANQNYTHPPTEQGQGLNLTLGTTTNSIILISLNNGGGGYEVGDILWVHKRDCMLDTEPSTFLVPLKVQVATITTIPTPPLTDPNKYYTIKVNNILNETNNITTSDNTMEALVYNYDFTLYNEKIKTNYKICDLVPQVIQGINLEISPSTTGSGLSSITDFIVDLNII